MAKKRKQPQPDEPRPPTRREAEIAKANADARKAEADAAARAAEAEARKAAAEAEAARAKAEADAKAAEAAERKAKIDAEAADRAAKIKREADARWVTLPLSAAAPFGGMWAGHWQASRIEQRHAAHLTEAGPRLKALADEVKGALKGVSTVEGKLPSQVLSKLGSVVTAADRLGLTRIRGPVTGTAVLWAGALLGEGAVSRFVLADKYDDPILREGFRSLGTASAFAATSLVAERLLHNATMTNLPAARDLALVEHARTLVSEAKLARSSVSTAGKIARVAGVAGRVVSRAFLPLALASSAYDAYKGYQQGGVKGALLNTVTFGFYSDVASAGEARSHAHPPVSGGYGTPTTAQGSHALVAPASVSGPHVAPVQGAYLNDAARRRDVGPAAPVAPAQVAPAVTAVRAMRPASEGPEPHVSDQFKIVNGRQVLNPWYTSRERMKVFGRTPIN